MKKFISYLFLALLAFSGNAYSKNINQGTLEFSGGTKFSNSSTDTTYKAFGGSASEDTDDRTISIGALYYFAPNTGVGFIWENQISKFDDGSFSFEDKFNIMGVGGALSVSIDPTSNIRFLGALILQASFESSTNGVTGSDADGDGLLLGATYQKFLNNNVSLNFGLTKTSVELDDGPLTIEVDSTELNVGFSVFLN